MRAGTYSSVLSVKDEAKVESLVGESCLIDCQLNSQITSLLLDTWAQSSVHHRHRRFEKYHPNIVVRALDEILDDCHSFRVQWGNTADIPFTGWVDMIVTLEKKTTAGVYMYHF